MNVGNLHTRKAFITNLSMSSVKTGRNTVNGVPENEDITIQQYNNSLQYFQDYFKTSLDFGLCTF